MKVFIVLFATVAYWAYIGDGSSLLEPAAFCDFYAARPKCNPNAKYRTYNGFCNNLVNPKWGAEFNIYERFMGVRYRDGVFKVIRTVRNKALPNARKLSLQLFDNKNVTDNKFSTMVPHFGQLIAEDMGSTADILLPKTCCFANGTLASGPLDPMCMYIEIDKKDPTYAIQPRNCMNFIRTTTDISSNCPGFVRNGPANQINTQTAYIDQSGIYGSNDVDLEGVRAYRNGLMKTFTVKGVEFPPYMSKDTTICPEDDVTGRCYLNGDFRANAYPVLATLHFYFIREHNRLARELKSLNPDWNDERLFQEARRINVAILQYIFYYQYLPEILGKWNMRRNLLIFPDRFGRVDDYDPSVNPGLFHEHAQAAYRVFHTMVRGEFELISRKDKVVDSSLLKDTYFRPGVLQQGNNLDDMTRGMCKRGAPAMDRNLDDGIKEFLFRSTLPFGLDLKALDIQRGRDVGLVSYNDAREYCGLPRATSWSGFADEIPQSDIDKMKQFYESPEDVELVVAGSLERPFPDSLFGKTHHCIIMKQFYHTRVGDRFWFETTDPNLRFTDSQLAEIRKTSLARVLCDNGRDITRTQANVFLLPSDTNPIVDCNRIPKMSLRPWKE